MLADGTAQAFPACASPEVLVDGRHQWDQLHSTYASLRIHCLVLPSPLRSFLYSTGVTYPLIRRAMQVFWYSSRHNSMLSDLLS